MAFDYFSKARMQYILTKIKGLFGQANGIASLDENSKVPVSQLPSATTSSAGTKSANDKTKLDMMSVVTVDTTNHAIVISTYADGNNVEY